MRDDFPGTFKRPLKIIGNFALGLTKILSRCGVQNVGFTLISRNSTVDALANSLLLTKVPGPFIILD